MSNNELNFSVQLDLIAQGFNNGINQANQNFGNFESAMARHIQAISQNTGNIETAINNLFETDGSELINEIQSITNNINNLDEGARVSESNIQRVFTQMQTHVAGLEGSLVEARTELTRLENTNATPQDIANARSEVRRLETELNASVNAAEEFGRAATNALQRAETSAENAGTALHQLLGVPSANQLNSQIDAINRELTEFGNLTNRSGDEWVRMSQLAEARINSLQNEIRGLNNDTNTLGNTAQHSGQQFSGGMNGARNALGSLQGMLAAVGLGIGAAEIIETADAFKTLEARVKLATGEGNSFITGFEGVKDIANETFSSVENTGELFARITSASEKLGMTQGEILSVTKSINQAIKLSGGSAASADAAITQLIQGLQSGVVRGEEFNSIMEQAPRLAKTMADSLGVGLGELRAMAAEGQLTSEVVINSIRSQGEILNAEFETLPSTVGNAVQVAKNKLFEFIGEMDKSVNQSSKLAEAINNISANMDNMDPATVEAVNEIFNQLMTTIGGLWNTIKTVYDSINGLLEVLSGTADSTDEKIGLITRTLQGVSIVLGTINDGIKALEIGFNLVQGVAAKFLSVMAEGLSHLTFGDVSASLLKMSQDLDRYSSEGFDKASEAALSFESSAVAALDNAAMTAQQRLSETAEAAEANYTEMKNSGTKSAEAIEGAFVEMANAQIAAYGDSAVEALNAEAAQHNLKIAINESGEALIESMSEGEIATANAQKKSEQLKTTYDEIAQSLNIGLSKAYLEGSESINKLSESFDDLEQEGYDASGALIAAINGIANEAKNTTELDDLTETIIRLGEEGKLSGQDIEFALEATRNKADELTDGINSVNEAFAFLGLTTQKEAAKMANEYATAYDMVAKSGEASAGQLLTAFQKTTTAAIQANGGVITSLQQAEAKQRGLTIAVDEYGRVTYSKMQQAEQSIRRVKPAVDSVSNSLGGMSNAASQAGSQMVSAAQRVEQAYSRVQQRIEMVKQQQRIDKENEIISNLKTYGQETIPVQGNQFGTRTGIETFAKSAGLDEKEARELARKLWQKGGGDSKKGMDWSGLQGYQEGQLLTLQDLANFKTPSAYLMQEIEKIKYKQTSKIGAPPINLDTIANNQNMNLPNSNNIVYNEKQNVPTKRVELDLSYNDKKVQAYVEGDSNNLDSLLETIARDKSLSGLN